MTKINAFFKKNKKLFIVVGLVGIIIAASVPSYFLYQEYRKTQQLISDPTLLAKEEAKTLTTKLGRFIVLPNNELPTVVTVIDKNKLQNQSFFAHAENGDKVLVYNKAQKAILYRPSIDKIIEMGPILAKGPTEGLEQVTPVPLTPAPTVIKNFVPNVVLYNGTQNEKIANIAQQQLKVELPNVQIVDQKLANKTNYPRSIVVDLTGNHQDIVSAMAQILHGDVGVLPPVEDAPVSTVSGQTIDILAIVGNSFTQ